jgi:hypothetical protein
MGNKIRSFAVRLLAAGALAGVPAAALAQQGRSVGGHVGIATPLVTVTSDDTTDIGDNFVLAAPIGVTVKLSDRLAVDFEMVVQNPIDPRGDTKLVIDPGLIYNTGPFALGLRIASAIGAPANVGLIPLINRGIAPVGGGTWFIEAAFPTFLHSDPDPDITFDVVLHTGIGF